MVREGTRKAKVVVKVLSDRLVKAVGREELLMELDEGEYTLSEIIRIITEHLQGLKPFFESRDVGEQPFIAVDGEVSYNTNHVFKIRDSSRITIFTVGAGG